MKIKGNWPFWIVVCISAFVLFIVITIIFFSLQKNELVEDNYYKKELNYEDHIQSVKRTDALKEKPKITRDGNNIMIYFPMDFRNKELSGYIIFYKPSDESLDFRFPVKTGYELMQSVSLKNITKGFWIIKLAWKSEGRDYYYEEEVYL